MKKNFAYLFFLFFSIKLFCQQAPEELNILNSNNAIFSKVLTGQAICKPANLSFGVALINDARSFICLNNNGKVLWERKLRFSSDAKLYTLRDNFLLVTTKNDSIVTVYNSSGIEISHTELNQSISGPIVQGFDTRLFIPLKNKILCYSLGGIKKWEKSVEYDGNIFLLDDGQLIIKNGNNLCKLSPYGELIEKIEIEKQIKKICQCKNGIIIYYKDSTGAYFSSSGQNFKEIWQLNSSVIGKFCNVIYSEVSDFLIVCNFDNNELSVEYLDEESGKSKAAFTTKIDDKNPSIKLELNQNGLLIINNVTAEFYDNFGTLAWKKNLSETEEEKPVYCILKNNNDLIFFCENWSINYFTIIKNSSLGHPDNFISPKKYIPSKQNIFSDSALLFSGNFKDLSKEFLQGNIESNEEFYINTLKDFYKNYVSTLTSSDFGTIVLPTQFESDISSNIQLISLSFNLQTDEFTDYIVEIIKNEKNSAILKAVLSGLGKFGYDANLKILNEINQRAKKISPHEENLIPFLCEATVSICKFMGKNAFEKYGTDIIKTFFSEQFSPDAKQSARNAYLKISKFFQYN